ncbi:MAG: cytochrome C biogenesis protein CycH [Omnitrophica bacterium RIFCSPLOWO2_12_FULL_44_17]|uniref:Cytochrome C biogenesis protein CycH n=1 Tax=Candidatus Danuiimicrobium aquiferis TaxID=1801832 RepID=A0A1G1L0X9_9BACT|nr:MAG: cytochrome C biogenesis protein CycH [Omnitrophica bacterium RIFCSPHIGHO2_02_FULL_45_28]OGW90597.1 MAG: cytochrome C biogenesis protein CycH [Omnitrophica bacterium RIFCSPHIGHO2_12_FULL_44_12]OGW98792.1 MAG: cytochrome C biogenesis protein CycH [Omnitrophica bacterium RIFCSPLOWO2_12_FULL_44_17]OGX02498.1 MAG: cytochrome C biogenesis protein CycH [Omnitrophica bacterium RIFCSPLOWO2_02_FULL_44_11]
MNRKIEKHLNDEVILYQTADKQVEVEVRLKHEMLWLSLNQIADLFGRDKSVISRHLRNIYGSKELAQEATVANYATVQTEGDRQIQRAIDYYNLDAIISVGYRVNSKRGTQFRIWATNVLRNHLIDGYTLNEKRLAEQKKKLDALQKAIKLIGHAKDRKKLTLTEAEGLLQVISDYSYALDLLDDYDHERVKINQTTRDVKYKLTQHEAHKMIEQLKNRFKSSQLFGKEKDESFKSSLGAIYQTFDGKELYPSVEEKAANLLYFVVKNHSFIDGNKRIAAAIFIWFLEKNGLLYKTDGSKRVADNALVALTLLIAESDPAERNVILSLVVNLINKRN